MLYNLLKFIMRLALRVFYKKFQIKNKERVPKTGPMLIVSNHPNTFMDPVIVASTVRPSVYFLAMGSLFVSKFVNWFLNQLHMIPIQRKHDTNKVKVDNKEIFQKCYDFLGKKGVVLIFPEGVSIRARRLQPIKTGAARIALGAEAEHDFKLGVKIMVVGLNYSNHESFRSDVLVNVGEPIVVKDFEAQYKENPDHAIHALTRLIKERLENEVIITQNDEQDELAKQIEMIYKPQLFADIPAENVREEEQFLISKAIVDAVQYFEEKEPARVASFKPQIDTYLRNLKRLNLNDEVFAKTKREGNLLSGSIRSALYFLFGFPFFLYGLVNNYIPYIIPSRIAARIVRWTDTDEYTAPVMMTSGVLTFGVFYSLQTWLCYSYSNIWVALAYLLSLPITGFFALAYARMRKYSLDRWRLLTLFYKRADLASSVVAQRAELIAELEKAKEEYWAYLEQEKK
jgi:1-acyl-sn-glycerol-3-phosphate acyltransferase